MTFPTASPELLVVLSAPGVAVPSTDVALLAASDAASGLTKDVVLTGVPSKFVELLPLPIMLGLATGTVLFSVEVPVLSALVVFRAAGGGDPSAEVGPVVCWASLGELPAGREWDLPMIRATQITTSKRCIFNANEFGSRY